MLFLNQILEFKNSRKRARVVHIDWEAQAVWLFLLDERLALPYRQEMDLINEAMDGGEIISVEAAGTPTLRKPTANAIQRRDKAHDCIAPLVQSPGIWNAESRGPLITEHARELGCSEQTLYSYLRSWWRGGQTRSALTPDFHRIGCVCGKTGGRGRPPVYVKYPVYQLDQQDHANFEQVIKEQYLASKNCSVHAAHIILLEKFYSYLDQEGYRRIKDEGEIPSLAQFRYYLNKHYSKEQRIRARKGDAAFELESRAKLGSLRSVTYTVGQVYEIDSTVADVALVHPKNREKLIGKPTLYMVRDRKSNLTVGFHVGLENSCWAAAMQALKSISEDKAELCRRYDVAYDPTDWPAHQVFPQSIFADRGSEMLSGHSEQLADGLEVVVTNLPARRADWKPHVECGFKQVLRPIASSIPGYTPPEDFGKRQLRDPTQDAALTLHEFTKLVLERIIISNRKVLSNNPLQPKYVLEGIPPSPINIWNLEIRERAGLLTRYSENQVLFALLPQRKASVSREGIRIGQCYYSADEAIKKGWFVRAGDGGFSVTVSYDSRLVDAIYVHDDKHPQGYFIATLVEKSDQYRGLSFAEVDAIEHQMKITILFNIVSTCVNGE